jgi:DNA helicase-4
LGEPAVDLFLSVFFVFLVPSLTLFFGLRFWYLRNLRFAERRLARVETELSKYLTFGKYLRRRERVLYANDLGSILGSVLAVRPLKWTLGKEEQDRVDAGERRARELTSFVDQFVKGYTKATLERERDFFEARPLDRDQIEAVVKNDEYNLVVASAGSGKTRALTMRLAFLRRCGVAPERILALAYTNSARDEMMNRLKNEYGINDVNIRTFHSLGRNLAQLSPRFRPGVADLEQQQGFIKDCLKPLRSDRDFATTWLSFAVELNTQEKNLEDFATPVDYYRYLRRQKYTTLEGKSVKSIAERDIANFFYLNGVNFVYEARATWADRSDRYRTYQPDFFLPDYDIWIEHWTINREGRIPDWFPIVQSGDPSARYMEGMEWKKAQFKKHEKKLIETYSYQWYEGTLIPGLKRQLEENRVEFREIPMKEILDRIQNLMSGTYPLDELTLSFINKAKTDGLSPTDIQTRLRQRNWNRRQRAFATMTVRVWQEYESRLEENGVLDFNDMINLALEVAKSDGGKLERYPHVLIDEFQDITDPQLELIKHLLIEGGEGALFCVGDDMQNIFSFAGSNVENILRFGERFPYPEQTILTTNYRCPRNIVEVSNVIAGLNRSRIEKTVVAASLENHPIRLVEMPATSTVTYEEWEFQTAKEVLGQLVETRGPGEEILVLCRYNLPLDRLKLEFPDHDSLGIRFMSIHRAKGTEADHVLLLGCVRGHGGFPCEVIDNRLLEIARKGQKEADRLEEERRLFYVALTRSKKSLVLFSSMKRRSRFISEMEPFLVIPSVGDDETKPPSIPSSTMSQSPC